MVGDVLAEVVQIEVFVNLSRTVSLSGVSLLRLLRARLARHDCDRIIDHNQPPPDLPQGGGVLYSAERIAGAKVFFSQVNYLVCNSQTSNVKLRTFTCDVS